MAAPELTAAENAHLRPLVREAIPRYGSANKLAAALGIQGSSLGAFLKGGGMAKATATRFAKLEGMTYAQAVGHEPTGAGRGAAKLAHEFTPRGYRPTGEALRKARILLKQPPQLFTDEAIDIAAEEILLDSQSDADRPGAVAEALRYTILGPVTHLPLAPPRGPEVAPTGTRRSRAHR